MKYMFYHANVFNKSLDGRNTSSVTNMLGMFFHAKNFNQPLNKWDVNNVTDVDRMFANARAFTNQDLSSWNVSNVPTDKHNDFMTGTSTGNTEPNW